MRHFFHWWETLGRAERIAAITNSPVWAIGASYMVRQKAQTNMWSARSTPAIATNSRDEPATEEGIEDASMGRMTLP